MNTGLDVVATLHDLLQRAVSSVPGAQRGGLLVRAGGRLVYRAAAGLDRLVPSPGHVPSDGGLLAASAPFGPAAAPEAARGPRVVSAAAWYRAHLPGASEGPGWPPEGAHVLVMPVLLFGAPGAYVALEHPDAAQLSGGGGERLESALRRMGVALERRSLFDEEAHVAQEIRLLEEVLNAVAESVDVVELIETLADGIRSVQTGPQWASIDLALLDGARGGPGAPGAAQAGGRIRLHRAPRRPLTSYWNNVHDGAMDAGRDLGADVQFKLARAEGSVTQGGLIEEGIRRGVRGIVIAPVDPVALEPSIRRAADAGIPVVAIDTPLMEGTSAALYIGTDNRAAGRLAGEMMLRLLPEGGAVAAQCVSTTVLNVRERIEGFREAVAGTTIRLEPPSESQFEQARALELARVSLQSRPDIAGAFGVCRGLAHRGGVPDRPGDPLVQLAGHRRRVERAPAPPRGRRGPREGRAHAGLRAAALPGRGRRGPPPEQRAGSRLLGERPRAARAGGRRGGRRARECAAALADQGSDEGARGAEPPPGGAPRHDRRAVEPGGAHRARRPGDADRRRAGRAAVRPLHRGAAAGDQRAQGARRDHRRHRDGGRRRQRGEPPRAGRARRRAARDRGGAGRDRAPGGAADGRAGARSGRHRHPLHAGARVRVRARQGGRPDRLPARLSLSARARSPLRCWRQAEPPLTPVLPPDLRNASPRGNCRRCGHLVTDGGAMSSR
ncbi:uncharacterized protein SOCE26_102690 [Sorangium cellulosum]|uniref:Periplasmic binding protein domain-containing protein n=1 Tax=Sorangium cellulosum TaxID=56 RepID=A0A2L0FAU7_SORCE|nr:uncharacterized protein SOCE26_102690 [Sorangium cellulosum]